MAKLTDAIKDLILNPVKEGAWTAQLGWIATVREDGAPNIGPKRSCRIYDDATLIWNENTAGEIMKDIERGSKVAVAFANWDKLDGYRFVGTAEVHKEGKYYDEVVEWAKGKMGAPKAAIVSAISGYRVDKAPTEAVIILAEPTPDAIASE